MLLERLKNNGIPELRLNELQRRMKAQVEAKIKDKQYCFEETNCAICASKESDLVGQKDRYGFYYSVQLCKDCGLLYTSPRMTQDSYNEFYNIEYRKLYLGKEQATWKFVHHQYVRAQQIYDYLKDSGAIKDKRLKVLEVGCGAGGILKFFEEKGHQIKGIDLGREYVEFGKNEYNLDLEVCYLKDLKIDYKPDIIIYSHVLEHILDVNEELKVLRNFCHKDTAVYIEVPGVKSIHQYYERNILKYFQNAHTYHFTLKSLKNLFEKNDFRLEAGDEFIRSVFKPGNVDSALENDFSAVSKYMKEQEKSRFLYYISFKGIRRNTHDTLLRILDRLGIRQRLKNILGIQDKNPFTDSKK